MLRFCPAHTHIHTHSLTRIYFIPKFAFVLENQSNREKISELNNFSSVKSNPNQKFWGYKKRRRENLCFIRYMKFSYRMTKFVASLSWIGLFTLQNRKLVGFIYELRRNKMHKTSLFAISFKQIRILGYETGIV